MAVTIRDVAKRAGVSLGTVSRYLNGYRLREENRLKVEKAIQELGFKQNIIAKGLKSNRSMTIGVVIDDFTNIFCTSIVTAIERTVEKENYSIILCDYEGDTEKLEQKLNFLRDRFVDGLILFSNNVRLSIMDEYIRDGIPIVIVNEDIPGFNTDKVLVDNAGASFRAVERFIHSNHTKIAIINGPPNSWVSQQRFEGYKQALEAYNLPVESRWIKYGNFTTVGGYLAAKEFFEGADIPTALYVTNYYMTLGAVMAIHELNIKVPQELSIIGFDYFELSDVIKPSLTVIEQPTSKMGEIAGNLILKRIKGDYTGYPEVHTLHTRMIVRDSVRAIS
ncbi:MAG: LacI family DNA-binding transcriptional regulator [Caldicoprobacter oshimai]|uniref:Transcriptional regulator, LacI family n=1 Tax=Caldicoprobacter faecalis TaxID=937334 RepID=A0A1I5VTF2_9FIRM|nr:LacI family DNA-binding transcriptional regulator [Caldicoprobacter faecalis]PZN08624.1 MAG: LacI family transcriptional regulator [Caldicoprobacter oshimai]SFQ10246.1 transcriptional regulator, LacI family [Caldicoprobacter faecalis]